MHVPRLSVNNMKKCKDCKYSSVPDYGNPAINTIHARCFHPNNTIRVTSLVLNNYETVRRYNCKTLRQADSIKAAIFNLCGKKGRWFEKAD